MRRDVNDIRPTRVEDVVSLTGRGRIVEMENDVLRACQGFQRAKDEILAALSEDLNRDIVWDPVLLDETTAKIKLDLRGRRKTNFDFLESDTDKHVEVFDFFIHAHRLRERLIAVAQIHAAPDRSSGKSPIRPLAARKINLG